MGSRNLLVAAAGFEPLFVRLVPSLECTLAVPRWLLFLCRGAADPQPPADEHTVYHCGVPPIALNQ